MGLSPVSCVAVLYHISHRVPGPAQIQTPMPIEISGVRPNLDSFLYQGVD
jgi:hypothetical protein